MSNLGLGVSEDQAFAVLWKLFTFLVISLLLFKNCGLVDENLTCRVTRGVIYLT